MILAPSTFLSVADQIGAAGVVVVADFRTAEAAEKELGAVRIGAGFRAVELAMVDPGNFEPAMRSVSGGQGEPGGVSGVVSVRRDEGH